MQENNQRQRDGNELDGLAAYVLASRLVVVPRFPRDRVAIDQVADWLLDRCQGAEIDGELWTPHQQAVWLIDATIEEFGNWEEARGLPAMRQLFNRKFTPPAAGIDYIRLGPPPPIGCQLCKDTGTVELNEHIIWCECEQALLLCKESPQLVEILDRAQQRRLASERRRQEKQVELDERKAAFRPKSPEEKDRTEDIRAEIDRLTREREGRERRHAKSQQFWTGPLSFLRWGRLRRVFRNWAGRILRARTSR